MRHARARARPSLPCSASGSPPRALPSHTASRLAIEHGSYAVVQPVEYQCPEGTGLLERQIVARLGDHSVTGCREGAEIAELVGVSRDAVLPSGQDADRARIPRRIILVRQPVA